MSIADIDLRNFCQLQASTTDPRRVVPGPHRVLLHEITTDNWYYRIEGGELHGLRIEMPAFENINGNKPKETWCIVLQVSMKKPPKTSKLERPMIFQFRDATPAEVIEILSREADGATLELPPNCPKGIKMKKQPIIYSFAALSEDRRYRYSLIRQWDSALPNLVWVGLNPSTADETLNDPTVRRVVGFSRAWGYGGVILLNLFAFRATNPKELRAVDDPVGPGNDAALINLCRGSEVVLAWGSHGGLLGRGEAVKSLLRPVARQLYCLGYTKEGQPKHPLYLPKTVALNEVRFAEETK